MFKFVRYNSTFTKLWVKHNGGHATQVPVAGLVNVSDLTDAVKQKLSPKLNSYSSDQLSIHKSVTGKALEPDELLSSISGAGLSAKSPLFVKTDASLQPQGNELMM